MKRREFLTTALTAVSAAAMPSPASSPEERICVFTDHVDGDEGFSYEEIARMLQKIGVAGPDVTVRPGGLVHPERVAEDLPKAAEVFKKHGLTIPMISTNLNTAGPEAEAILETASKLGIRYFKVGYYEYRDMNRWRERRQEVGKQLAGLVELGRRYNMQAGFHNHSGPSVGGSPWDGWEVLEPIDAKSLGFYYDPAHAMIEGGKIGWNFALRRMADRIHMVAMKDFVWEKVNGKWRTRWVPLGEGMVPFKEVFAILKNIPFPGPISLHIEYDLVGTSKSARLENALAATDRDVKFIKNKLREASRG